MVCEEERFMCPVGCWAQGAPVTGGEGCLLECQGVLGFMNRLGGLGGGGGHLVNPMSITIRISMLKVNPHPCWKLIESNNLENEQRRKVKWQREAVN